jgi:hypothetical protein
MAEKMRDPRGMRNLVAQVFLDQGVHHPFLYFPVFYVLKDWVTSDVADPVRAVGDYRKNMQEDLVALWKVWIPSMMLNFGFMPMWGRIPWVASTSLIWTSILSAMRGASEAREAVTGDVLEESVPASEVKAEGTQRGTQLGNQESVYEFVAMPQRLGAR